MLDEGQRTAILQLKREGLGVREIARTMRLSRKAVRKVLRSESAKVPAVERPELGYPHRDRIRELLVACKGNLVRVHEELAAEGVQLSYPALTAFCRRHEIGQEPKQASGQYHFKPGEEMQHDTSPHMVWIGGELRRAQTASLVLCYSRMVFCQLSPTFRRFDCKTFLTEAVAYMGGACARCMIDNTHLVVLSGTGREMVPVPEMEAFGERYGYVFEAHEKGDANRSARVERRFSHIENNFLAGRRFRDWEEVNREARLWCDKVNATYQSRLKASPRELFAAELEHLKPLPRWVPPVYLLHQRIVDVEGYVSVNRNRYSVPENYIGRQLEVRETRGSIEVFDGPRLVAAHRRVIEPVGQRTTLPEHRRPRGDGPRRSEVSFEEKTVLGRVPELAEYVLALKRRAGGRGTLVLRRLLRLVEDYPREPLLEAVRTAKEYGLYDLERLERMVLRRVAREYFSIGGGWPGPGDDDAQG